jgi:menaquinone-dependent protoporphyrinogen IX oxidase
MGYNLIKGYKILKYSREIVYGIIKIKMWGDVLKGLIVYKTKYGSTRQYAQWISDELKFDIADVLTFDSDLLEDYDIIIIGSHIFGGKIMIADWVASREQLLQGKPLYFFTVSGTPPKNRSLFDLYRESIPDSLQKRAQYFAFHGKMRYDELDRIDKMTMNMGVLMSRKSSDRDSMRKGYDHVKKKAIFGLVNAVKKNIKK